MGQGENPWDCHWLGKLTQEIPESNKARTLLPFFPPSPGAPSGCVAPPSQPKSQASTPGPQTQTLSPKVLKVDLTAPTSGLIISSNLELWGEKKINTVTAT